MQVSGVILNQLFTMFLYMALGYVLYKTGLITKPGSRDLANLLVYVIMPCIILRSFAVEFSLERLKSFSLAFLLSFAALLLSIVVSGIAFRKKPIDNFGASYSNAGYMGIPLVSAALGSEAVFYVSTFVAMLNLLQWTHGAYVMTSDKSCVSFKKIIRNPVILSVMLGIMLFFLPVELPGLLDTALATVGGMNSPVAMIILGCYLAQTKLRSIFTDLSLYPATLLRLLVIPLLTLGGLALLPDGYTLIKLSVLVVASAPIGTNVAIFAHLFEQDYTRAVKMVCLSTPLCAVTMPLVIALGNLVL